MCGETEERICKDKENLEEKEGRKETRLAERKEGEIEKKHKNLICTCVNEILKMVSLPQTKKGFK
jgi:transcription elongation GreA/GreB family factor